MSFVVAGSSPKRSRARASELAFGRVLGLLQRLGDVLARPGGIPEGADAVEFEDVVCGLLSSLRAGGASEAEIVTRLTRTVTAASPASTSEGEIATRVAAVVAWCARREEAVGDQCGSRGRSQP